MVKCYKKFVCLIVSAVLVNIFMLYSPCSAATVALSWDANTESNLAGYKVYYQADSPSLPFQGIGAAEGSAPVDVYNKTTATISGLDPGRTYYFAITAYDTAGMESSYSNIVTVPESAPPTVTLSSPANNSTVSGKVSVIASASDNVTVSKVEFYVNGILQATDTASPYAYSWDTTALATGTYTLLAKAFDAAGNVGQSNSVAVTVIKDTTAPVVLLTAPGNNYTVSGIVAITASASDNAVVSTVEFYSNGTLLFASNIAPYAFNWNTASVVNGSYTLMAKAYDNSGNSKQSANVSVTVNNLISGTSSPAFLSGDINVDGNVNVADALLALQIAVGKVAPDAGQLSRGDIAPIINGTSQPNGKIDIGDVIVLLGKVTGKIAL
jgi:fibronectin type 3 domain-containing protein